MIFTKTDQSKHRKAFIEEYRQKAWGVACHADWIAKQLEELLAHYEKLQAEDRQLDADIKELASAQDYHTVENRDKRKMMQERRNELAKQAKTVADSAQEGQKAMSNLRQSVEASLQLAQHAEKWEWKEVTTDATEGQNS